jgi:hypothetical protein
MLGIGIVVKSIISVKDCDSGRERRGEQTGSARQADGNISTIFTSASKQMT